MATTVTVVRAYVNAEYFENTSSFYPFQATGSGGTRMNWVGGSPYQVGTYGGLNSIEAQRYLQYTGQDLLVGDVSSPDSTAAYGIVVGSTDANDEGAVRIVGNQTGALYVGEVTFHNEQSGNATKEISNIGAFRDGDNDAGRLKFAVAGASAVVSVELEIAEDAVRVNSLAGTGERIVTSTADGDFQPVSNLNTIIASASGGGTTNYLRADGTWEAPPGGSGMVYPGAGIALSTGSAWAASITNNSATWNAAQPGHANLTSLAALSYASTSFVKMTAAGTFALDTNTYNNYTHPNHSGQVTSTGDGAQVLTVSAITAQTALTSGLVGTDELLVNNGGVINRMDVSVLETYMQSNLSFGTGTVTSVTGGTGIDSTGGTTPSITLDCNELAAGGTLVATDKLVAVNGTASQTQLISSIPLSIFNNDSGWNNYTHPNHSGQVTSSGDGAQILTVTAITGQTATTTIVSTDELVINDGGVIRRADISVLQTYMQNNLTPYTGGGWTVASNLISPASGGDDVLMKNGERIYFFDTTNYIEATASNSLRFQSGASVGMILSSTYAYMYRDFSPGGTSFDLGRAGYYWDNIFGNRYYIESVGTYIDVESDAQLSFTDAINGTVKLGELLNYQSEDVMFVEKREILFADAGATLDIADLLPGDVAWWDARIFVETVFNGTAPSLRIGNSGHTTSYYLNSTTILTSTGWKTLSLSNDPDNITDSGGETINCGWVNTFGDVTQGVAYLYLFYTKHQ